LLRIKVGNLAVDLYRPAIKRYSYPLLFIHGAGGTSRYLKNYLLFFARAGWLSYAVNLRGHFPSDHEAALAQVTIEDYIADVERVMTFLGIENCALIGHSMGGLIAQRAAMHFRSVRGLVTIASAPPAGVMLEMKNDLPYSEAIMNSMWGLFNLQPVKLTYFLAEKTVLNNIEEIERKNIFPMFVAESLMIGYQVAQGVFVDAEQIVCPKLVIGCRHDLMASESMERNLAEFLKADYISYDQFAHLPMLEKGWEQSARDISKWLISNVQE
jgi:pimeloyl-ACP methyl ester carboxylesterase